MQKVNEKNLRETVDFYVNNKEEFNKKVKEQQEWAKKYLSVDFIIKNILNKNE